MFHIADLPGLPPALVEDFDSHQATFAPDRLFFLREPFISETCAALGTADDVTAAFLDAARAVAADEGLMRFAWHLHLRCRMKGLSRKYEAWPFPADIPMFYALVYLSCVPHLLERNGQRGVSREITLDTLTDLEIWIRNHHRKTGRFGLSETYWMARHFDGQIFKLGRLQFELSPFRFDFRALKNRTDGSVMVLAGQGMEFRADGQFADADETRDPAPWKSVYENTETAARGNPISPRGFCERKTMELPLSDWEVIAGLNDPALAVHIPATGPMDFKQCGESFRRAKAFFAAHFPEYRYRAFTCVSWLLNPDLEIFLPPDSNIVRFLKPWHLCPAPGANARQTYDLVFGDKNADLANAPARTSLQKAMLAYLRQGNRVRNGGGLLFPHNLNWC